MVLHIFLLWAQIVSATDVSLDEFEPAKKIHPSCVDNVDHKTKQVTHYMVPLLEKYDDFVCNKMEGTCIYKKNGVQYLHSFGFSDVPLSQARCKNGYGNRSNCLHPCRTIAASMKHHRFGQIVYIPSLVGYRCGNKVRDGYEMIHDGFVMVGDTGSPKHFNALGRFDFFWGRCKNRSSGQCLEGAVSISRGTSQKPYCIVWDPNKPNTNKALRRQFIAVVKREARTRGDHGAADELN